MTFSNPLEPLLAAKPVIVIDGALATELERRGLNLNSSLWSAKALLEHPQSIHDVHVDYFLAGADVAITASYQASAKGLREQLQLDEDEAKDLIRTSVALARRARENAYSHFAIRGAEKRLLVAGSVGPYGAYLANGSEYRGDYELPPGAMQDFHRSRIQALVSGGVDLLACETMPSFAEIEALAAQLASEFPHAPAWFSFTLRDAAHLSDGTPLSLVLAHLDDFPQVLAVGVNCVPEDAVTAALGHMGSLTSKPLLCYPNSGEVYDAVSKTWTGRRAQGAALAQRVAEWRTAGARLIGGCCRTTPGDIEVVAENCRA
ncbi:AdoMet-homocysteine methyltransferase [Elasticomyces elasticus]|nr:AdoMet-homocysteine methyltransferase [Elasticomyces elasticus]